MFIEMETAVTTDLQKIFLCKALKEILDRPQTMDHTSSMIEHSENGLIRIIFMTAVCMPMKAASLLLRSSFHLHRMEL
jgi:hypothetical protein